VDVFFETRRIITQIFQQTKHKFPEFSIRPNQTRGHNSEDW